MNIIKNIIYTPTLNKNQFYNKHKFSSGLSAAEKVVAKLHIASRTGELIERVRYKAGAAARESRIVLSDVTSLAFFNFHAREKRNHVIRVHACAPLPSINVDGWRKKTFKRRWKCDNSLSFPFGHSVKCSCYYIFVENCQKPMGITVWHIRLINLISPRVHIIYQTLYN